MYNIAQINATTIPDAWFQSLYKCIEIGKDFKIDRGSNEDDIRLEFDMFITHIKNPDGGEPGNYNHLIPIMPEGLNIDPPLDMNYLNDYVPYLMSNKTPAPNEAYTYGQRICGAKYSDSIKLFSPTTLDTEDLISLKKYKAITFNILNQMETIIWTYKNKGHRNNQMCISVAQPSDMLLKDPPCLRLIDTRIQDNKLHFIVYFRSWDLYNGFPVNLAAIEIMKQYMSDEIGVKNGEIFAMSKGLHLYSYVREIAEVLRGKTIEEFRSNETKNKKGG